MKYCDDCKCEHEDYVEVCSECGKKLLMYDGRKEEKSKNDVYYEKINLVYLSHASSNNEANLLLSQLNACDIKGQLRYEGAGSYLNILHGNNYQGVDVYVSDEDLELAKAIVSDFTYINSNVIPLEDEPSLKKQNLVNRIVAFVTVLAILIALLFSSVKNILLWR